MAVSDLDWFLRRNGGKNWTRDTSEPSRTN
jgi:hypothetical protein